MVVKCECVLTCTGPCNGWSPVFPSAYACAGVVENRMRAWEGEKMLCHAVHERMGFYRHVRVRDQSWDVRTLHHKLEERRSPVPTRSRAPALAHTHSHIHTKFGLLCVKV